MSKASKNPADHASSIKSKVITRKGALENKREVILLERSKNLMKVRPARAYNPLTPWE